MLKERAREKHERRAAQLAAAEAEREAFHRDYLDRDRAAAALGISVNTLRRWITSKRGPTPCKAGDTMQSRTFWAAAEIAEYLRDPAAYERAKRAESSAG